MSKLNEMSIRRSNVVVLNDSTWKTAQGVNDSYTANQTIEVAKFAKKLHALGYAMESRDLACIMSLNTITAKMVTSDIMKSLKELISPKDYEVFYKNFPQEVLETEEFDLYLNSFLHYLLGYVPQQAITYRNTEVAAEKEMFSHADYKMLRFENRSYLVGLLKDLVSTKVAPSQSDVDDIKFLLMTLNNEEASKALNGEIPFKEVLTLVVGELRNQNRLDSVDLSLTVKTATDLLRVIAYINTGSSIITSHMPIKLKNSDRRFILNTLESLDNPVEDLLRNKMVWRDVAKLLHAKKSTHPRTFENLQYVFDAKKFVTFNSKVEPLVAEYRESFSTETLRSLLTLLEKRPSELGRRLDQLVRYAENNESLNNHFRMIKTSFEKVAFDINSRVLYQIRDHFLNRHTDVVPRLVAVKNITVNLENEESLSESKVKEIIHIVDNALVAQYVDLEPLGKVYIDDELENYAITTSERTASKSHLNPLTSGSRIPLVNNQNGNVLRTFVYWKNISEDDSQNWSENVVDIDSSIVFLDKHFNHLTECTYYNLKAHLNGETIAVHSGDITSAPKGASEFVDVDVSKAKAANIRYVSFNLNSYSVQTMREIGSVRGGFMWLDEKDTQKGAIHNEQFVKASNDVTTDSTNSLMLVIDLETMEMIWIDKPITIVKGINNVGTTSEFDTPVVKKYALQDFTSLKDLYTLHALARGSEIVSDKREADVVFEQPNSKIPLNIADIVANWI